MWRYAGFVLKIAKIVFFYITLTESNNNIYIKGVILLFYVAHGLIRVLERSNCFFRKNFTSLWDTEYTGHCRSAPRNYFEHLWECSRKQYFPWIFSLEAEFSHCITWLRSVHTATVKWSKSKELKSVKLLKHVFLIAYYSLDWPHLNSRA